jgi:hypothetical protein
MHGGTTIKITHGNIKGYKVHRPIPVATRSKAQICGGALAGIAGSNPDGALISVSNECCVLLGRGLCFGLITGLEECGVSKRDRDRSITRRSCPT